MGRNRTGIWILIAAFGLVGVGVVLLSLRHWRPAWTTIQGAVIRRDSDSRKEAPIAGVHVTGTRGTSSVSTDSDAAGYFRLQFRGVIWPGQVINLKLEHPGYEPLELRIPIQFRSSTRQLVIAVMTPESNQAGVESTGPQTVVSDVKVRYTVNSESDQNIGPALKIFQVVNKGNVPCRRQAPCSPDGYWKATTGSVELDAGPGNEFREARASCIAGPCPFTHIDTSGFIHDARTISVSATDWSDTATFLLEAAVFHTGIVSNVRELYPVEFGRELNFTLPPTQEGVCLEAKLNGQPMVFPLGPDLFLSWAECMTRRAAESMKSTVYQCELKPGYRF